MFIDSVLSVAVFTNSCSNSMLVYIVVSTGNIMHCHFVLQTKNKSSGMLAALKQVDITSEEDLEDYSIEIDILDSCKHENIVALYESFYFGDKLYVSIIEIVKQSYI